MKRVLLGFALAAVGPPSGCMPVIDICGIAADDGTLIEGGDLAGSVCEGVWFLDADEDGIGGSVLPAGQEGDPRRSPRGGDCRDDDPGNFPGNFEVCDGRDNDCFGGPDYDVEGEEEEDPDSYVYSCSPDAPMQFFLLGGTEVNDWKFSRDGFRDVLVEPGGELTGRVRIRMIVPAGSDNLSGAASRSWESPHEDHHLVLWDADDGPPVGETILDFELPADSTAPEETEDAAYVTIAGGTAPTSEFVGSLTEPGYCTDGPLGDALCPPQWDGVPLPPGAPQDAENPDRDLADLDELDLAACRSLGAARVSYLVEARSPLGGRCAIRDGDCNPVFSPRALGCTFVQLRVE